MFRWLISALTVWGVGVSAFGSQPQAQVERKWTVYRVDNVNAKNLAGMISGLLEAEQAGSREPVSSSGPETIVTVESATNSLIVSALPDEMRKIESLVRRLDMAPPMVRIDLMIVELAKDKPSTSSGSGDGAPMSADELTKELGLDGPGTSTAGKDVEARISALQKAGRLRVVRRPQLVTMDNQRAELTIGRSEPYVTGTARKKSAQQNSISYRNVGLTLAVTPRVSADYVVAHIRLSESHLGPADEGAPIMVSDKETIRSPRVMSIKAQSVVRLRSGRTVVLGGLAAQGLPDRQEQIILVTASIVRE